MKRSLVNFAIDAVPFINISALVITGFIIRFILPPGTGGLGRRLHDSAGREHVKTLLSMTRHQWGDIHFYLAVLFTALIAIHLILHWNWIKEYLKSITSRTSK